MRILIAVALIISSTFFIGCQRGSPDGGPSQPASSLPRTEADLLQTQGRPVERSASTVHTNSEILTYPQDHAYQVADHRVVAGFRNPQGDEGTLQYWRHRWEGHEQEDRAVAGAAENAEGGQVRSLYSRKEMVSVLYQPTTGIVVRVIDHGTP